MSHLDICSPSYEQKKGRESNWQSDSRPLKVGNRPIPDVHSGSATPVGERREYYREYGGGISRARAVVCHVSLS